MPVGKVAAPVGVDIEDLHLGEDLAASCDRLRRGT
eukprot:gene2458-13701_t